MTIEEMIDEFEIYYEAAGFVDIYERELKYKTDDEIRKLYKYNFTDKNEEQIDMIGIKKQQAKLLKELKLESNQIINNRQ